MHQIEHARFIGPGVSLDAVKFQRLGGRAAALVQGCDEAGAGREVGNHGLIRHLNGLLDIQLVDLCQATPRLPAMG